MCLSLLSSALFIAFANITLLIILFFFFLKEPAPPEYPPFPPPPPFPTPPIAPWGPPPRLKTQTPSQNHRQQRRRCYQRPAKCHGLLYRSRNSRDQQQRLANGFQRRPRL